MTSHTLYMTSHTWQHKSYICHLTLYMWHFIHYICVIKPSVSILLHPLPVWHYTLYVWHHIQYAWHHMNTLWHHTHTGMTSHAVYLWHHIQYTWYHPYYFMKIKTNIPGISPTEFDITATASVWSHPLYQCLHNNYGSLHTWHTYDIIHTLYHIKFRLYDINHQYLGHHKHCIHDIRSPIWTWHPRFMTPHPLYLRHHSPYIGNITPTMFVNTYQLYLTWNPLC